MLQRIVSGEYAPGGRLVETRIAQELGVSQASVREALRDLEHIGCVSYEPYRGCCVRTFSRRRAARGVPRPCRARVARRRAGRAAMTAAELDELDGLYAAMLAAARAGDPHGQSRADAAFHGAIARGSRNATLERQWTYPRALLAHVHHALATGHRPRRARGGAPADPRGAARRRRQARRQGDAPAPDARGEGLTPPRRFRRAQRLLRLVREVREPGRVQRSGCKTSSLRCSGLVSTFGTPTEPTPLTAAVPERRTRQQRRAPPTREPGARAPPPRRPARGRAGRPARSPSRPAPRSTPRGGRAVTRRLSSSPTRMWPPCISAAAARWNWPG